MIEHKACKPLLMTLLLSKVAISNPRKHPLFLKLDSMSCFSSFHLYNPQPSHLWRRHKQMEYIQFVERVNRASKKLPFLYKIPVEIQPAKFSYSSNSLYHTRNLYEPRIALSSLQLLKQYSGSCLALIHRNHFPFFFHSTACASE